MFIICNILAVSIYIHINIVEIKMVQLKNEDKYEL